MADNSKISWTHNTWNPWFGCTKCGAECQHCYIPRNIRKQHLDPWADIYLTKTWKQPYRWQEQLKGTNQYKRVFTCSLGDFFDRRADRRRIPMTMDFFDLYRNYVTMPTWREAAWRVIKNSPNCVYLVLTKRPERIVDYLPDDWEIGYPNVWLGTSVGCNQTLGRIEHLRRVPVHPEAVRFLSCEPLLEDISEKIDLDSIGWVICGGESGDGEEYLWTPNMKWTPEDFPGRRTMKLDWAWALRTKAKERGLPFWFKQITAPRAGQGEEVFGRVIHQVPNPPSGGAWWIEAEAKPNPLVVLQEK
jgi:protein gp37